MYPVIMNCVIIFIGFYMLFQRPITADGVAVYAVGHM